MRALIEAAMLDSIPGWLSEFEPHDGVMSPSRSLREKAQLDYLLEKKCVAVIEGRWCLTDIGREVLAKFRHEYPIAEH